MNSMKHSMERGQALVLIALAAVGLFGIVGLAIDGSAKFSDRRHAQNAVDTAALAAALTKTTGLTAGETASVCSTASGWTNSAFCLEIIYAAWDRAQENGYDGILPNSVDVYSPPISGPYLNDASYVQVIITSHVKTYFAKVIGINETQNVVEAVALTKEGGPLGDGAMIISYDPHPNCSSGVGSGGGSVDVSGSGILNLNGGGIFVNSSETCGYSAPNCPTINITGGAGINSAGSVDNIDQSCGSTIPEHLNQDPVIVPDGITMPAEPAECSQAATAYQSAGKWHITPGYYASFPQTSLNGDIVGNKQDIVMDSGVYCVGQDIHWSGSTFNSLDGSSGVTIYLKSGVDFALSINSPIVLNASKSGDYKGYLIVQNGTSTSIGSCKIDGGAYLDIEGTVFAPYCDITVNGGSEPNATINAQLVGWDLKLTGNNSINFNYDPSKIVTLKSQIGLMR